MTSTRLSFNAKDTSLTQPSAAREAGGRAAVGRAKPQESTDFRKFNEFGNP